MEASWKLLAVQGIEQFTMRSLAAELGIQAPSIYWYFKSKQLLFQALANEVAKEISLGLPREGGWKERLLESGRTIRLKLREFPCSAQIFMQTRPEPDYLRVMDQLLGMVESAPISDEDRFSFMLHLLNYVLNYSVDEYEQKRVQAAYPEEERYRMSDLAEFPLVRRIYENGLFRLVGSEEMFESGLLLLLDGMERKMAEGM
ncbi:MULTISPECIES: TetR/AcrR family transcriptional regulator [unclassified Paenibacillus]|uniref:TetR/AcrR family transcriptional regulator n=1 Tax=unclassified Paenibacillus TaxID=185978 RepID=UPI000970BFA8|nr:MULTISPECIES: TetR/AcrR family transcriptional regulator [unclassified Paenibacillus]ASS67359.1 TetR/AcrR family transcriptional regulator [Paenibacillus sp. RUD330]